MNSGDISLPLSYLANLNQHEISPKIKPIVNLTTKNNNITWKVAQRKQENRKKENEKGIDFVTNDLSAFFFLTFTISICFFFQIAQFILYQFDMDTVPAPGTLNIPQIVGY